MKHLSFSKWIILLFITGFLFSCKGNRETGELDTNDQDITEEESISLPDIEVEVMDSTVRIGKQRWMRYNLDKRKFRNGDPITEAKNNPEWQKLGEQEKPVVGYYLNDRKNAEKYGAIYNWHAVSDPRGLCPEGWKVPDNQDWKQLIEYLGGEQQAGQFLKDSVGWLNAGNGNNLSGFSALPGGFKGYDGGSYFADNMGRWWTSTEQSSYFAFGWDINADQKSIVSNTGYKLDGFSVRCIKE
jgi:uncharacterized protein (TIGR02145 family)